MEEIVKEIFELDQKSKRKAIGLIMTTFLDLNSKEEYVKINEMISEFIKYDFSSSSFLGFLNIIRLSPTKKKFNIKTLHEVAVQNAHKQDKSEEEISELFSTFEDFFKDPEGPVFIVDGGSLKLKL